MDVFVCQNRDHQNAVSQNMKSHNVSNEKTPEIKKTRKGGFHMNMILFFKQLLI